MSEQSKKESGSPHPSQHEPKQLYLAQFTDLTDSVFLGDGTKRDVSFSGEILVAGQPRQGQPLIVDEFRRVSLWIEHLEELGGLTSFVGPADKTMVEPGLAGTREPFDMRFYYPLLSDLDPACEESDALYPQLKALRGRLTWELEDGSDRKMLGMRITITLDKPIEPNNGAALAKLKFGPSVLSFQLLEERSADTSQANSLEPCDGSAPPVTPGNSHERRRLKLRFINLSRIPYSPDIPDITDLKSLVQELVNRACEVWWKKGGIKIEPEADIVTPTTDPPGFSGCDSDVPGGFCVSPIQEGALLLNIQGGELTVPDAVEIYLVDQLTGSSAKPRTSGGVTHNCGTSNAYVILEIKKAEHNKYLLSHELGHVLGLRHPGEPPPESGASCQSYRAGSYCSIMLPEKTTPSSRRNTLHNIGVIEEPSNPLPMGPVFISFDPPQLGGWSPDDEENFYHIIRDQPYDDGTETSPQLEPPAINFGTHSDVWNSDKPPHPGQNKNNEYDDGTPMFGPDHSPTHTPPLNVGRNHMCVRLHTCEPLTGPVNVYFYLAAPFTGNLSPLLEGDNGPHLVFDIGGPFPLAPQPGEPTTKSVEWTVPNGYSPNSSIFAVATSAQEGMPPQDIQDVIYNPTAFSSSKLEPVQSDNDVAWRGDFIQLTTTVSSSSSANAMSSSNRSTDAGAFSSMLPWLQIANPSEAAAAAHLEIDTSLAPNLAGLSLELDEKPLGEVNIGGPVTVNLAGALQPDERMTLRLHALLPLAAPEGTTYPINLRFFVDNQLIGGYQYVLRVAPLSEAVVQVLDHLFGALRDVAAGFETDAAQDLAGNVREIILREKGIEARRGFWGLVQRVFSPKPGDWQTELGSLASRVAALAQSLEVATSIEPECQVMCQHLYELAGRLLTIADTESPNLFIEQVRDVVDHIQEPAGRLARRL